MALINITPIQDGTTAQASQVNTPLQTIVDEFNGNISSVNLANGAVTTNKLGDGAATPEKIAAYNRQNDTTNTTTIAPLMQHGWGYIQGDGNQTTIKGVTFPVAFSGKPTVHISMVGAKSGSNPTDIDDTSGNNTERKSKVRSDAISTTSFNAVLHQGDATSNDSTFRYIFAWTAIGPA